MSFRLLVPEQCGGLTSFFDTSVCRPYYIRPAEMRDRLLAELRGLELLPQTEALAPDMDIVGAAGAPGTPPVSRTTLQWACFDLIHTVLGYACLWMHGEVMTEQRDCISLQHRMVLDPERLIRIIDGSCSELLSLEAT